ncbi:hypothetical protein RHOM_02730 [Roseburia hominis A2-183]|uniref:Uncharacterized protein n=1 Tax=Roseburia hominis (strain DSM 16839 / JCM 17582 / NCIMB 14029 / A2-183) TaxID=585394 RepID=G2T024_ROSHA|nr:hypothetical protein RHOM_02730 [Roseburia hominis A2-183]
MARRRCITHRVHVRSGKKKKNGNVFFFGKKVKGQGDE